MRQTRQGLNECFPASACALFDLDWTGEVRPKVEAILGTTWAKADRAEAVAAFMNVSQLPEWVLEASRVGYDKLPGNGRLPKKFPIPNGTGFVLIRRSARRYYQVAGSSIRLNRVDAIRLYKADPKVRGLMRYHSEGVACHVMLFDGGRIYDTDSPEWELDEETATREYGTWRVVKVVRMDGTAEHFGKARELDA